MLQMNLHFKFSYCKLFTYDLISLKEKHGNKVASKPIDTNQSSAVIFYTNILRSCPFGHLLFSWHSESDFTSCLCFILCVPDSEPAITIVET